MITSHTAESLQEFERLVAADFDAGMIRAPVHLAGGNEKQLINIFDNIHEEDWVLTQWRSHYHCLLKGVPPELLRDDILSGRSITLCYPDYRILSSAIVGGVLPIAVGLALSLQRERQPGYVWVFVGDMTARTGMFHECLRYVEGHELPVNFVIEDNGKSVCTDTDQVWGKPDFSNRFSPHVMRYDYVLPWPHSGAGKRVQF